jgi:hypothetical protein
MKKLHFIVLMAIALAASAAGQARETQAKNIRIDCESTNSFDPYVRVRGIVYVNPVTRDEYQARGSLSFVFDSPSTPPDRVSLDGTFVDEGRMRFLELKTGDQLSYIDEVYLDLMDGPFSGNSFVGLLNGGFYRMSCNRSSVRQ